jgi:hypothetical protein
VLLVHVDVLAAVLHPLQAVALREAEGGGHARARVWRQPCPACGPLSARNSTTREAGPGFRVGQGFSTTLRPAPARDSQNSTTRGGDPRVLRGGETPPSPGPGVPG